MEYFYGRAPLETSWQLFEGILPKFISEFPMADSYVDGQQERLASEMLPSDLLVEAYFDYFLSQGRTMYEFIHFVAEWHFCIRGFANLCNAVSGYYED